MTPELPSPLPPPPPSFLLRRRQRQRPHRSQAPQDAAAAAQARFDKHFPKLDSPPERFRSSFDVGTRVMRQQAGQGKRLVVDTRSRTRAVWRDKDRWWRAVTTVHAECEVLQRDYGIAPGEDPSEKLPRDLQARWRQYHCGHPTALPDSHADGQLDT
mmetsp:Transcript_31285/g.81739  ORF Transcript_31285/g.81739 Transcript_31285/m.81739 type:complete len:157 (-) Transcript_31285:131-601(-)